MHVSVSVTSVTAGMVIQGIFLFAFGPYLASWISPNLMEQASIWWVVTSWQQHAVSALTRPQLAWPVVSQPRSPVDCCVVGLCRCFFSIAQISIMLFFIRETLVLHWGRTSHRNSLLAKQAAAATANGHANGHANGNGVTKKAQ